MRAAREKIVAEPVKESGCLRYELHQSLQDGRVLVFVETWESEAQWWAHMQGAAIKHFHASGAGNLIEDFSLIRMNLVADGQGNSSNPTHKNHESESRRENRAPQPFDFGYLSDCRPLWARVALG